jgi:aspartate 1-decarboxylase
MQRFTLNSEIHRGAHAQYGEAELDRHEAEVVHAEQDTNSIIDVDAAVATLLT